MVDKKAFLDEYSETYSPDDTFKDFDALFKKHHVESISKNLKGSQILELGCASGYSTKLLDEFGYEITVVEGSLNYISMAQKKYEFNNVKFINSLWEEYTADEKFTDVLLVDSLQLVDGRKELLLRISKMLTNGGRLHLIVPNNNSFHRILGKEMQIISSLDSESTRDHQVKAKQNMNWTVTRELVKDCDFKIINEEGILFKLFDNQKMLNLDAEIVNALFKLGNKFKDNAAHIYLCCEKND